jgi:hypothetical protein
MSRRIWILTAVLAAAALPASEAPAFSDGSGSVVARVSVPAPPAPCLQLSAAALDYGVKPFSTPSAISSPGLSLILTNCGTAGENVLASATDATGPSGSWTLFAWPTFVGNPCAISGTNNYSLLWGISESNSQSFSVSGTPRMETDTSGAPWVIAAGHAAPSNLGLFMPCQGSNGAGETKTFTATFTAVMP